jgi:transcriptional regulator with XRE-family HTH domain
MTREVVSRDFAVGLNLDTDQQIGRRQAMAPDIPGHGLLIEAETTPELGYGNPLRLQERIQPHGDNVTMPGTGKSTHWIPTNVPDQVTLPAMKQFPSFLAYVMYLRGDMRQADLMRATGVGKQQINRFYLGKPLTPEWAKKLAPALGIEWLDLFEGKLSEQLAASIEQGIAVRQGGPSIGQFINDPDELAMIRMWRRMSVTKKAALLAFLQSDEPPASKG